MFYEVNVLNVDSLVIAVYPVSHKPLPSSALFPKGEGGKIPGRKNRSQYTPETGLHSLYFPYLY